MKLQIATRARSDVARREDRMFAMKCGVIGLATAMALAAPVAASTPQRAACGILSLAEVRTLVHFPVSVFVPGSAEPTTTGNTTVSMCTYVPMDAKGHLANGRSASVTLLWGPNDVLTKTQQYWEKQQYAVGSRGGALAITWVGIAAHRFAEGSSGSKKLLAAILQRL